MLLFSLVFFFLLERDRKRKNYERLVNGLGNPIPYKMMFVSATKVKNCGGEDALLVAKVQFSGGWKNTSKTRILTCVKYQRK